MRKFLLLSFLILAGCAAQAPIPEKSQTSNLVLQPANFSGLPGWGNNQTAFYGSTAAAFEKSCARIMKTPPGKFFGPLPQAGTYGRWQELCRTFMMRNADNDLETIKFFEDNFTPYAVLNGNDPDGLFTGYYQTSLGGSRTRSARYNIPLHTRPADLVMVNLGEFREELKGQRIAGRVEGGQLKPYEDRAAIVSGNWPHNDKVLVWVDDAVDAFFVQIQGSGVVILDDGQATMTIGYAGQNGHVYTAIGKELIARGALTKENVSMQSIAAWLHANPSQADEIMNVNRSYVFFEEGAARENGGAKGAEGVILTPEASLAVDHSLLPYGVPLWLDTTAQGTPFQRLMIAQDTGGAITGPVRGDVFWGYGEKAELMAGAMKSPGRYWVLLAKP
ncbi:MAG: murein transglycosylase A [Alphaproteobacteria bacterium]